MTTFEAAILALMVREEPVKARFASPSVHSQRINPSRSVSTAVVARRFRG